MIVSRGSSGPDLGLFGGPRVGGRGLPVVRAVVRAVARAGTGTALAGFDDVPLADLFAAPLTVVAYDVGEVGRRAAQLLLDRLDPAAGAGHARMITVPTRVQTYRPLAAQ